jgi:hypothetical protein
MGCQEVYEYAERCIRRPASSRLSFTVVYTSNAEFKVLISQRINVYLKILYNTQGNESEVSIMMGSARMVNAPNENI